MNNYLHKSHLCYSFPNTSMTHSTTCEKQIWMLGHADDNQLWCTAGDTPNSGPLRGVIRSIYRTLHVHNHLSFKSTQKAGFCCQHSVVVTGKYVLLVLIADDLYWDSWIQKIFHQWHLFCQFVFNKNQNVFPLNRWMLTACWFVTRVIPFLCHHARVCK